jgi:tetraacyldisaccharide 4'-kinase
MTDDGGRSAAERIWRGGSGAARFARAALAPAEAAYGAVVALRNQAFDRGWLTTHALPLPAISVGNLQVGGTGKTPVSSWFARELAARGARPAVVLRGYGGDEPRVHELLLGGAGMVIVGADRLAGAERAKASGCDVVVFDDAFQLRRAARVADVVLLSAERFTERPRLLPAGEWREPLASLARASLVLVTRKVAQPARAAEIAAALTTYTRAPVGVVALVPGGLARVGGEEHASMETVRGARVLAIAAVGDPDAFAAQLRGAGARVELAAFRDHHPYSAEDVTLLVRRAADADVVVSTLKDAVKLGALWPRSAAPLWYVLQRVALEAGAVEVASVIEKTLRARTTA